MSGTCHPQVRQLQATSHRLVLETHEWWHQPSPTQRRKRDAAKAGAEERQTGRAMAMKYAGMKADGATEKRPTA